ncbi:MAG: PAS domain-containing protein, partial [Planctomycetaceae bacterium]|nr:PAS domain-containing protein [Planctomycetaceae bacterium]
MIGASAGGLEACTEIVQDLPADLGISFVYYPHLGPTHQSFLSHLLSRNARLPIVELTSSVVLEPNKFYVAVPGTELRQEGTMVRVLPKPPETAPHLTIDAYFESVARAWGGRTIGILLSGLGSDGTRGLRAIRTAGGITIVQDPASATHDSMPQSAIEAGVVDRVVPAKAIARELTRLTRHHYVRQDKKTAPRLLSEEDIRPILDRLREVYGLDFPQYKQSTLQRRVSRRLAVHGLEKVEEYLALLGAHREEFGALLEDLLIHVTSFFRDFATFEALCSGVFKEILTSKRAGEAVRIWVPGCSTGEEAYSIAITLVECLQSLGRNAPVQILASDVSEAALKRARLGEYSETIRKDVSDERLKRFFVRTERGYTISQKIREMCIFVRHDVTRDPPFSRLDLISCRNLLIYLGPALQKRAVQAFHFALNPKGFLLLSDSESIAGFSPLFRRTDKKGKIYARKPVKTPRIGFSLHVPKVGVGSALAEGAPAGLDLQKEVDQLLLARYVPAAIIVNEHLEILQFRGETAPYISPVAGKAEMHLFRLVLDDLVSDVRLALHEARKKGVAVTHQGIQARVLGQRRPVAIEVVPLKYLAPTQERHFLVLFRPDTPEPTRPERPRSSSSDSEAVRLKGELALQKDSYRSLIEEYEGTTEQLTSAHEEVLSTNEELQSANEELETAKEELQSANEELSSSNQELSQVNNDITNFVASMGTASIMLGPDLRVRRLTPACADVLKLLPADVGRPITELPLAVGVPSLGSMLEETLRSGAVLDREVTSREGRWYRVQVRPYVT